MGLCYDIVCDNCRVALWIGQLRSAPETFFIYGGNHAYPSHAEQIHSPLAEFLHTHKDHPLRVLDSRAYSDAGDYLYLDGTPGIPVSADQNNDIEPEQIEKAKAHLAAQFPPVKTK